MEVIIPQVLTTTSKITYDTFRWEMIEIETKRTLTECAKDGVIPNMMSVDKKKVLEMVRAAAGK